jgi:flagellar hook-associated protein 2
MATGIQSLFQQTNPYSKLIDKIMEYESIPKRRLENQVESKQDLKKVVGKVDSKLSALQSAITPFTESGSSSPFGAMTVDTGDSTNFSASATDSASPGAHSLTIHQLAQADTRVSTRYDADGTGIRDNFFDKVLTSEQQTFSIEVASPDDGTRESIDVTIDASGLNTNEEILTEVKNKINTAMTDAVDAGTITDDEKATASLTTESDGTVRLSLRSADSGYTNRLSFTDSGDGFLDEIELNADHGNFEGSDTSGGQVYRVGTGETDTELNSKFDLDGLTYYRDSNTVDDALSGVTLELNKATGTQEDFTVKADSEAIKEDVQKFIDKFNDAQDFIDEKTNVDEETKQRGPLAGDFTFRNLQFKLRTEAVEKVDSQAADEPQYLNDVGIEMTEEGRLRLADEGKLMDAIESDRGAVESLFNASDGVATRMESRIESYVKTDGLIDNREEGIDAKIDRLEDRVDDMEERLANQEQRLREQYAQVQETIAQFQSQQQHLQGFGIGGGQNLGGQFF